MQRGSNVKATSAQNGVSHSPFLPLFSFFFSPFLLSIQSFFANILKTNEKKKKKHGGEKDTEKTQAHKRIQESY